jgi:23S rRNA (pseudouridine1915-N3)-methyltransferase
VPTELIRVKEGTPDSEKKGLLAQLERGGRVIALDERGALHSTTELAAKLERYGAAGHSALSFIIGGADGLAPEVLALAEERWSLSRFTLPHRLALVVLAEQLYRAHTLLRREPYHRA